MISRVICRKTILITHIRGLITLLIATHEPPSTFLDKNPAGGATIRRAALPGWDAGGHQLVSTKGGPCHSRSCSFVPFPRLGLRP